MTGSPAAPRPGDTIGGKYRVERALGAGAMGSVFEVTHRLTGKRFAVKLLNPELAASDASIARFMREARVAGRFEHPNVVEVYDIGSDAGAFYIVMELLQGEPLAQRLAREQRLPASVAVELMLPCLRGVAAAHAAGVVHRDLKPANIFLCCTRPGGVSVPKVLDFGVAKLLDQGGVLTLPGAVLGTPLYMSPEQLRGEVVDARADIYALGAILYELVSGRRPFEAATYADLALRVLHEKPVSLEQLVPDLPAGFSETVEQALARDREQRYGSVDAFIHALAPSAAPAPRRTDESLRAVVRSAAERTHLGWPVYAGLAAVLALAFAGAIVSRPQTSTNPASLAPLTAAAALTTNDDAPPRIHVELQPLLPPSSLDAFARDAGAGSRTVMQAPVERPPGSPPGKLEKNTTKRPSARPVASRRAYVRQAEELLLRDRGLLDPYETGESTP